MAESDLDPQAFLKTVRDLSDKRQREDNERYEQLEAQILQDRNARLERKLERERSLSPEKTPQSVHSASRTPINGDSSRTSNPTSPAYDLSREDSIRSLRSDRQSPGPVERSSSPTKPSSPSAAMPSRANTMSWQRRPQSGARSRPLSMLAAENATRASGDASPDGRPNSRDEPSQQDIAKALSSKDPSWFRQTPDRGAGSAAYRRQRDEELEPDNGSQRRHLPGFASSGSIDATRQKSPPVREEVVRSPPRFSAERDTGTSTNSVEHGMKNMTLEAPRSTQRATTPEVEKAAFGRTVPSLQSRPSATARPASPTKGMGGFVESAMMKRTDSVSKRWSNQPAGLGRQDSTASLRSPFGSVRSGISTSYSMPKLDHQRTSAEPSSRPGSSHSTVSAISNLAIQDQDQTDKPSRQHGSFHNRSKSVASLRDNQAPSTDLPPTFSPPLSPSKRWSPTKSSWLESALSRPESPTKQMTPQSNQPTWMAELSKAKQQRNSVATTSSQEDVVVEMGTASVKSFQPMKASTTTAHSGAMSKSSSRDVTPTEVTKRNFTPPTKSKPPGLVGKLSRERLNSPTTQSSPTSTDRLGSPQASIIHDRSPSNESAITSPSSARLSGTPSLNKPKPETPPKTDFRSGLKPRQVSTEEGKGGEPEFKNAMEKLKKTTTQNYVAPDVLKNNILRGKAGLSITGGPQKTVRRDDFKESILAKKAEMKTKAPEPGAKPSQKSPRQVPTPEALQIKKGLQRSDSSNISLGSPNPRRDITPEALARQKTLKAKVGNGVPEKSSNLSDRPVTVPFQVSKTSDTPKTAMTERKETSTTEAKSRSIAEPQEASKQQAPETTTTTTTTAARSAANAKSNSFADRFNPALAGLLARGPPAQSSAPQSQSSSDTGSCNPTPSRTQQQNEGDKSAELTHITKGRARGPKRRKPKSGQPEEVPKSAPMEQAPESSHPSAEISKSHPIAKEPVQPRPKPTTVRALSANLSGKAISVEKPPTPTKTTSLPVKASVSTHVEKLGLDRAAPSISASPALSGNLPKATTRNDSKPVNSPALDGTQERSKAPSDENKENGGSLPSVKNAAAMWGKVEIPKASTPRAQPVKLPSREDEEAAMRSAGLLSNSPLRYKASKPDGLGIPTSQTNSPKSPLSPPSSGGLPPKPGKSSRVVSQSLGEVTSLKDEDIATTPKALPTPSSRAEGLLHDYFGTIPRISSRLELDAQAILSGPPQAPPGRTLRKSIHLVADNGKLTPLPTEKEYVLFTSSIYILTHVFGNASGQRQTDVFLWAGLEVGSAAVEDAQIFAKRVAKDAAAGSRTIPPVTVVKQAREPASFFQALGGIVIIRKGSHADTATRPYLLCGRPHLGHIAFDEVDLSLDSLCSAFPYILVKPTTIQDSKVFLWKGSACGPETVGSARLISMDLASSDVDEVAPGKESDAFLSVFPSRARTTADGDSRDIKISEKTAPRLFRFDVLAPRRSSSSFFSIFNKRGSSPSRPTSSSNRPTSSASNHSLQTPTDGNDATITITEVSPFSQEDFEPEHIYLMDCVNTVMIIPGPLLSTAAAQSSKSSDPETKMWEHLFAQACLFGNDYAMLAAGMQDRASVPQVKILLGEMPRHVKMLFRGWDERRGLWGAAGLMAGQKVREGEGMLDVGEVLDCCAR